MANYNSLKNKALLTPSANVSLGSDASRYTDIFLSGNVNIAGTSINSTNAVTPRIATIAYVGNDTAASPVGGQTITLTGSGFVASSVYVGGTIVASVSVVNSTQITFVAPAKTAGSYSLNVVNSDGASATFIPGMQYSGIPAWSTVAGSLGSVNATSSVSITVAATSDSTVSYSVTSGSLPSGLSLNSSTGAITGTAPNVGSTTTYNFTIRATDSENQDTDRNFSITITAATMVEYLVVAGGGAGGSTPPTDHRGGGGGGGGFLTNSVAIATGYQYTVTVGAGGTVQGGTIGSNGNQSSFNNITSTGGGGGGMASVGSSGGSGGGGGAASSPGNFTGGSPVAGQGFAGGTGGTDSATYRNGGGGGGAGAVGGAANSSNKVDGGAGASSAITGSVVFYAGGGGGYGGVGGVGGGGAGGVGVGGAGTANTGGGGGGGGATDKAGGAGGSGVVIVRYPDSYAAAASTTGSPTVTTTGGYRVYKFTSSGSITF